jgi:hypothetical protein
MIAADENQDHESYQTRGRSFTAQGLMLLVSNQEDMFCRLA